MSTDRKARLRARGDDALRKGLAARKEGDLERALRYYQRAIERYRKAGLREREVLALVNRGAVEQQQGLLDKATRTFTDALKHSEALKDPQRIGVCTGNLAAIRLERGQLDEAEPMLRRALECYQQVDDPAGAGNQLGNLGMLYQQRGDHDSARVYLDQAAQAFVAAGHTQGAAGVLRVLAEIERREGRPTEARDAFERALVLSRDVGDHVGEAYARRALGQLHMSEGALERATAHFKQSLTLHREVGDVRGESAAHLDLGQALAATGSLTEGLEHLETAVALARQIGTTDVLASALVALGSLLATHGELERGERLLIEAESEYAKAPDTHGLCGVRLNLVLLNIQRGQWSDAQRRLDGVRGDIERANLSALEPSAAALSGQLAQMRGHVLEAQEHLQLAIEGFTRAGKQRLADSSLLTLSLLEMEREETTGLEARIQDLIVRAAEKHNRDAEADGQQVLGELYRLQNRHDDAEACFLHAEEHLRRVDNAVALSSLLVARAELRLYREPWSDPSSQLYARLQPELAEALEIATRLGLKPRQILCLVYRADAHRRAGSLDRAQRDLDDALQRTRDLDFPMAQAKIAHFTARLQLQQGDAGAARASYLEAQLSFRQIGARVHSRELEEDFAQRF